VTRQRPAIVDVSFTVTARDAGNALTAVTVDKINTRAIVLTWDRLTLINVHRTVETYSDQPTAIYNTPEAQLSKGDHICDTMSRIIRKFSHIKRWLEQQMKTKQFGEFSSATTTA